MSRRATAARVLAFAALVVSATTAVRAEPFATGVLVEHVACRRDPTQTYTLYLPSAFTPEHRWPLMLIFDPRGRSVVAAELFRDAAEQYGWILMSSNDTRSDGPMEPNVRALNALFPDALERFPSDPKRLYLAGFSGGAMLAWAAAARTAGIAGVIASCGRWIPDVLDHVTWANFGATGTADFNYAEMHRVEAIFAKQKVPHRLEVFEGRHAWMPREMATEAVSWMELQAMKRNLRPVDAALVERLWAEDEGAAKALEVRGEPLAALRRFEAVADSFDGLRDVTEARNAAARLAKAPAVKAALKDEKRCAASEASATRLVWDAIETLRAGEVPMPAARLANEMRLADLLRRAAGGGCEGEAATRVLETVFTETSGYLTQEFLAAQRWGDAAAALAVAAQVRPDRPAVWYNLACAQAREGKPDDALATLGKAIELGFADAALMARDEDLASLRARPEFAAILARIKR